MAGAFTHFMICYESRDKKYGLIPELKSILFNSSEFLYLGAVSPDLPYLSFKGGKINWADVMHYEKTNSIAIDGHNNLKKDWAKLKDDHEEHIKLAWLFGFISHLIADATIHPIVEAEVGPYHESEENRKNHRICEMTQDSLIFKKVRNQEIDRAEFSSYIKLCGESSYRSSLFNYWRGNMIMNYSNKGEIPNPKLWFETYTEVIDIVENGLGSFSRHIGSGTGYVYQTSEEIISNHPDLHERYYTNITLPDGRKGDFYTQGFLNAVKNVVGIWNKLYEGMDKNIDVSGLIKNWNLDNGVDIDLLATIKTFWNPA